jgi:hypothetical protein
MTTYVSWIEDTNGDAVDVQTYCILDAPADARRWPCYGDQLNPGEIASCATCGRYLAGYPAPADMRQRYGREAMS